VFLFEDVKLLPQIFC